MRYALTLALCALPATLLACSSADDEQSPEPPTDETTDPMDPDPATSTDTSGPSSAAPAMCQSDADCPDGVACITETDPATGAEGPGHCDVADTTASPTSAAPAPCNGDADCPDGVSCVSFDGTGPGFCDVAETAAN